MHIHISELNLPFPIYGALYFIGIAVAAVVAVFICKKRELPKYDIVYSAVYSMIGAAVGAKLLFIIISLNDVLEITSSYGLGFWDTMLVLMKGGFVFYGGFIGGFLGLLIYVKQFKMKLLPFLDVYAAVVPLGHAFGRVGCLFGGCCYGIEYDGPFAVVYHSSLNVSTPLNTPLLPMQLIEALGLLLIFAVVLTVYLKGAKPGTVPVVYILCYSVMRFTLEFLRSDSERGSFLGVSTSQWISLALIAIVIISVIFYRSKKVKTLDNEPEKG
jgi:phosphatidylglycerol:prolipoprotein diacylglycerol transferase